jgi:aspartate/tyrosine/aromatic aminotransferase
MKRMLNYISPDVIFQLSQEFQQDPRKGKINGGIGIYLDEKGKQYILPVVKKAIRRLDFSSFAYLPIGGDQDFLRETIRLVLGQNLYSQLNNKIAAQGTIGGTNGLFLWANLIKQIKPNPRIIIGDPTWSNHLKIFEQGGFKIIKYRHLDKKRKFNLEAFQESITKNPGCYVLFHGGKTHNPTGINPKNSDWKKICLLLKKSDSQVIIDQAYLGLGESIGKDCVAARTLISSSVPTSVVISYSKNMSLYQHRVGVLFVGCKSKKEKNIIESHLRFLFRISNSNPAGFGENIAREILMDPGLKKEWVASLKAMVKSLQKRRSLFARTAGEKYLDILDQKGLFSLLDINRLAIEKLKKKEAIYLLPDGRINFGGLSLDDTVRVAQKIAAYSS